MLLVQLSKTSTFFTDHAPTSSNGTAAITATLPEVEVELAPHDDQDQHHQPDVDRAPEQHQAPRDPANSTPSVVRRVEAKRVSV